MKLYIVQLQTQTDETDSTELEIHSTYEKARNRYFELINIEKTNEDSWVFDAFDKNGKIKNRSYTLDEHRGDYDGEFDCWFDVYDNFRTRRYYLHLHVVELDKNSIDT